MSTQTDTIRKALTRAINDEWTEEGVIVELQEALAALSEMEARPTDLLMTANDAQVSSSATPKEGEELVRAAQAVVDRWDTPLWKDVPHTGEFIGKLREALSPYTTKAAQP